MKKLIPWVVFALILVIFFVFTYFQPFKNSSLSGSMSYASIIPGESVEIEMKENSANSYSFVFDGSLLSGQSIPQRIQISALNSEKNMFLRVKYFCRQDIDVDFDICDHFSVENDGYVYYDDVLNVGEKVCFSKNFVIPITQKFESGKKYIVTVLVESLQDDINLSKIWK